MAKNKVDQVSSDSTEGLQEKLVTLEAPATQDAVVPVTGVEMQLTEPEVTVTASPAPVVEPETLEAKLETAIKDVVEEVEATVEAVVTEVTPEASALFGQFVKVHGVTPQ